MKKLLRGPLLAQSRHRSAPARCLLLGPKAELASGSHDVRFVPGPDILIDAPFARLQWPYDKVLQ